VKHLAWIDLIPASWEIEPLRATADYVVSNVDKLSSSDEVPVRLCNYTDVYKNEFITPELDFMQATATEDEIAKFGLLVDDVIITKDSEEWDDIGIPALVRETANDLVCGYHLALLHPKKDRIFGRFLLRCLQAKSIRIQLELAANGVTRFGIPKSEIGAMKLPLPPLPIQKVITDYLDRETIRIDELITAKERLLELFAEKRQALISHAVIRGIDPNISLKDSGIPWFGKIPAHWEVERSRWLFRERDDRSETGDEELLTVSHITGVTPRSEKKDVNMFEAETKEGYKICFPGDLAINTLWAWMGAMGVAPVKGIVSPSYHVYTIGPRLNSSYIDSLVRLPVFAQEVIRYSKGVWTSRLRLYPENFFEIYLPVPPLNEQQAIVDFMPNQEN
jgi:type I restriction enzyme S subunit